MATPPRAAPANPRSAVAAAAPEAGEGPPSPAPPRPAQSRRSLEVGDDEDSSGVRWSGIPGQPSDRERLTADPASEACLGAMPAPEFPVVCFLTCLICSGVLRRGLDLGASRSALRQASAA